MEYGFFGLGLVSLGYYSWLRGRESSNRTIIDRVFLIAWAGLLAWIAVSCLLRFHWLMKWMGVF